MTVLYMLDEILVTQRIGSRMNESTFNQYSVISDNKYRLHIVSTKRLSLLYCTLYEYVCYCNVETLTEWNAILMKRREKYPTVGTSHKF